MRAILLVASVATFGCRTRPSVAEFTLRVAVSGPLEPVTPSMEARNWAVTAQPWVFEPLARIGNDGGIVPVLAARIETLGSRELRLWIRTDARFEDGSAITFADVVASLPPDRLKVTQAPGEAIVIQSVETGIPPEILLARAPIFRRVGDRFLGSGPFAVREQNRQHIVLQRRARVALRIDQVLVTSYATPNDAFAHTLKGDADFLPEAEPRWVEFFEGVPRLKVIRATGTTHINIVAFNLARLSKTERIALAQALALDDLRVQAFGSDCMAPGRSQKPTPLPAGRSLDVMAIPLFERFALAVRRALGARGGEVRVVELRPYFEAVTRREFDLVTARPQISPPSMAALIWHSGSSSNVLGYSNPAVDSALDARDWSAAQRALDDDPPAAFVCARPNIMIVDSRIRNATTPADLPQWEIAE